MNISNFDGQYDATNILHDIIGANQVTL